MFSHYRNKYNVFFSWTVATVVLWGFDLLLLTYLHKRNTNRCWDTDCISLFQAERLRWCFPVSDHFLTWEIWACVCTYQVLHFGIRKFIGKKTSVKWLRKLLHANLSGFRLSFQHCIGGVFSDFRCVSSHLSRKLRLWTADVSLLRAVWHRKRTLSVLHNLHRQSTNCQKDLKYCS